MKLAFLIDTNIAIHARDGTDAVLEKLAEHDGAVLLSAQCGRVKGRDYDRMIAAQAMSTGSVLVTNNEADFRAIPGLKIEIWAAPEC